MSVSAVLGRLADGTRRLGQRPLGFPGAISREGARLAPSPSPDLSRPVRRVVVTGARGRVGTLLLPWMRRSGLTLECVDRRGGPVLPGEGPVRRANLRSPRAALRILQDADAVLHLAGRPWECSIEDLMPDNIVALGHLLRAAVRRGVGRVVFASSMHVVGLYGRDEPLDETSPPRPDSHYAASKLHGEALCRLYAEKHGLSVTCLRLGSVAATLEEAEPGAWISPEDVAQMVEIALRRDRPGFEIFHAVADYPGSPLAPSRATAYGYRCLRPAEPYPQALARIASTWRNDALARQKRGAVFASRPLPG